MPGDVLDDPAAGALWFRGALQSVCDASMPRAGPPGGGRKAVYWWSPEIAQLRAANLVARRQYTKARRQDRRRVSEEQLLVLRHAFAAARHELRGAIARAKDDSCREFVATLNEDPWGRPYRAVSIKLGPWAPPVTEGLDPRLLDQVLEALFPPPPVHGEGGADESGDPWLSRGADTSNAPGVSDEELATAVARMRKRNAAPGPDGVPGRVLACTMGALGAGLKRIFNAALRTGRFPPAWKEARLVLLRKPGRPAESPSAYRPICLLDEAGKLLERVIAARLCDHLEAVGPDLSDRQYGFRRQRSTIDAIKMVRSLSRRAAEGGGVSVAVSLDIANAFNTVSWAAIERALLYHNVPLYLRRLIWDFLRGRVVTYVGREGDGVTLVYRGVPQGSVLGPLLWILAYDAVLRVELPSLRVSLVCYADDTLVVAAGQNWKEAISLAEETLRRVITSIGTLGLRVALDKTEAMWLADRVGSGVPNRASLRIGDACIRVGRSMKYLGLTLDTYWRFTRHFKTLAPRLEKQVFAFGRIMPNLGGPHEGVRRLYVTVVRSMALYGAPIWAGDLEDCRVGRELLARVHRRAVLRAVRAYRTVSHAELSALAGSPPFHLLAEMEAEVYSTVHDLREAGDPNAIGPEVVRGQARQCMGAKWLEWLALPRHREGRVVGALLPIMNEWVGRGYGRLTFRLTQILTGVGCFGNYLRRIGREESSQCFSCDSGDEDTADHTLAVCRSWSDERRVLESRLGPDLSLPTVVRRMAGDRECWKAVSAFAEAVMLKKEEAERDRIRTGHPSRVAAPRRSGRIGRRR